MIKIGIVESHDIIRQGLVQFLKSLMDFDLVLENDGTDFLKKLNQNNYGAMDIILIDLQIQEINVFDICVALKNNYPKIKIILVSNNFSHDLIKKGIINGVNGYLPKDTDLRNLETTIRKISQENYYFDSKIANLIGKAMLNESNKTIIKKRETSLLSKREIQIIELICKEYNTGEIAAILCLNYRTIESHRKRIMLKTGAKNFIGVVIFALKNNLIQLETVA